VYKTSSIKVASSKNTTDDTDDNTNIGFSEPTIDNSNKLLTSYTNALNKK
jgi:hypothetical protein